MVMGMVVMMITIIVTIIMTTIISVIVITIRARLLSHEQSIGSTGRCKVTLLR